MIRSVPSEKGMATDTLEKRSRDAAGNIEKPNLQFAGVLPKTYDLFSSTLLRKLLNEVIKLYHGRVFGQRRETSLQRAWVKIGFNLPASGRSRKPLSFVP